MFKSMEFVIQCKNLYQGYLVFHADYVENETHLSPTPFIYHMLKNHTPFEVNRAFG